MDDQHREVSFRCSPTRSCCSHCPKSNRSSKRKTNTKRSKRTKNYKKSSRIITRRSNSLDDLRLMNTNTSSNNLPFFLDSSSNISENRYLDMINLYSVPYCSLEAQPLFCLIPSNVIDPSLYMVPIIQGVPNFNLENNAEQTTESNRTNAQSNDVKSSQEVSTTCE